MEPLDDDSTASQQRATRHELPRASLPEEFLLRRIHSLEDEVGMLREANEHLVLAAVQAQHLQEDAEAANRRQNEFLAMLAHELRNPLSPISMAASLLDRMPDATPQLHKLSRVIGRQVEHMAKLLDDLLDAARISSGKITLSTQPLVLADVLQQAVETMQSCIQERRQTLQLELPPESVVVEGDQVRLTQVFTNLLANASKYTGDGGMLHLAARADGDQVSVAIRDNGNGIAPEIIPYIFDLFTQGPRSLARSEGGLGVGLNVVRNLVGMHAGSVTAESAGAGQGSCFTVRLPRSGQQSVGRGPAEVAVTGGRKRILVVEDNPDTCATLAACLREEGHEVVTALDGRSGLAAALERPYDVIVCDIGLPGLDGLGLMRAVRAAVGGRRPLAIALTGYGQPEDQARGMEAGFDHYLVKPVGLETLLSLIGAEANTNR
ncbi:hybrid sensor histidine kinase/response regulator [Massilia sp. Bi118]|uniref:hybrid sensor histidine kinase/response regulator n=1 Tax=Massilia sp. Bi118 TaxID=2822346 RepID=UPI001E3D6DB2|nr:hybrid sensor histidine kinase/response regulator [Massilia sp. Bi118]